MIFESQPSQEEKEPGEMTRRGFLTGVLGLVGVAALQDVANAIELPDATKNSNESQEGNETIEVKLERMKEIVETYNLRQKIAYIRDMFGFGMMPLYYQISRDIELLDKLYRQKEKLTPTGTDETDFLKSYDAYWNEEVARKSFEPVSVERPLIEGGNFLGLSNDEIYRRLEERFDKRWLYANVASIHYIGTTTLLNGDVVQGHVTYQDIPTLLLNGGSESDVSKINITLNRPAVLDQRDVPEKVLETLSHELAHINSWGGARGLTAYERLDFFFEVAERLAAGDRFKSHYVESIVPDLHEHASHDVEAQQKMEVVRVGEYWAELAEQYFSHPIKLKEDHPKDYELFLKWYNRVALLDKK